MPLVSAAKAIRLRGSTPYNRGVSHEPLSEEQREVRDLIRDLSRERIAPRAAEIDKSSEFPWDVVGLFREHDVFALMFDEEYGGAGASALMTLVAIEEVSKVCATSGLILAVQELGSLGIKLAGTEDQKQRFLPKLASGEWLPAYALTEPGSGSDSAAMRSEARRDGDQYVLNGSKRFITNAGVAGLYVVFAKTDPDAGGAGNPLQVRPTDRRRRQRLRPDEDLGDGEALLHRRGDAGHDRRRPNPGRLRLHAGVPGRADDAGREDHADLRGHEPDPAARD